LKIAVNTRFLIKNKLEGFGWFTFETLKRITQQHPEHEFIFLFDRPFDEEFIFSKNVTPVVIAPPARHPILFYIWFELSVTRALKKHKVDLFLSPDGYLSLKTKTPTLAVIHDLNFEHFPEDLPKSASKYLRRFFPKFAKKASRIATVSNFSKKDIKELYNINPSKIDVIYNGVNEEYFSVKEAHQRSIKEKFTFGADFFVYIGSLHPRKNITRLFQAFDQFKNSTLSDIKLVIIGEKYWWNDSMNKCFKDLKHNKDVIFTGRLPNEESNALISSAIAMTYISYFEGFGIPALEAMSCQTPLITSNTSSLPEVVGDAAIMVDPFNLDDITNAMVKLYKSPEERKKLIELGNKQVQKFSWQKTADGLWESILKTVKPDA